MRVYVCAYACLCVFSGEADKDVPPALNQVIRVLHVPFFHLFFFLETFFLLATFLLSGTCVFESGKNLRMCVYS